MSQFCISCGAKNQDEAKFCKSCGQKLKTEEQVELDKEKVVAKNKATSSKVKVFVLKSIAFFIALIAFSIARVIFSAMSGSDKMTMGGILLFYGVYALLSGLFLNDKEAKTRGGWVLLVYVVGSIIFTIVMNNVKTY